MTYFNDTYDDYIAPSIASITKEQFMAEIKANSNPCAIFSMGGGFERGFGIGVSDDDDDGKFKGENLNSCPGLYSICE